MKNKIIFIIIGVLVLTGIGFGAYLYAKSKNTRPVIRQAVFLTNGQVYFGEVESKSSQYVRLKNIFYLKTQDGLSPSVDSQSSVSLLKLGEEIHGPEDQMYINRDQILFYENMRSDSKINQAILKYLQSAH